MISINPDFEEGEESLGPKFEDGDLVRHRRYGYRGVVVCVSYQFEGDEAWYQSNQTKPDKNQAWYHVLVDEIMQNTYAAESSLETDPDKSLIDHPLLEIFFSDFKDGRYVRNEMPWEL